MKEKNKETEDPDAEEKERIAAQWEEDNALR